MGRRLFDAPLSEGRPPMEPATEAHPHEVALWPWWKWYRDGQLLRARCGDRLVSAHNHAALVETIAKIEAG